MKSFFRLANILLFVFVSSLSCSCQKENKEKPRNTLGLMTEDKYFADENFNPIIRFTVCSDIHYGNVRGELNQIVPRMINYTYNLASTSSYKNYDACLIAGDISDTGTRLHWNMVREDLDNNLHDGTQDLVVMGNHDFRGEPNAEELFAESMGYEKSDFHVVINGFHFICLSPSNETSFSSDKVNWLEKELEIANSDDSNKPIFVMQHMAIAGTVIGSKDWGVGNLTSALSKYPQVVDFSGHSHFPMKDPRSIWQGDFTALGCGTMFYYETGLNGYKSDGLYPSDELGGFQLTAANSISGANFYVVEVDASNALRITGHNMLSETVICRYGIKNPSDKSSFCYTESKKISNASVPFFDENHNVYAAISTTSILLDIDQAYCNDLIESYRVEVFEEDKKIGTFYSLSGYYLDPMPEFVEIPIYGLKSKTEYTVNIYAISVFSKANSAPLSYKITTY